MSDLIDRQEAISRAVELRMYGKPVKMVAVSELERLPSARAEHGENSPSEQPQMNELGVKTGETCADTISRQALIDKLIKLGDYYNGRDEVKRGIHQCIAATYELPSAQPETHEKRTETHACDCISRQAALDCFHDWIDRHGDVHAADEMPEYQAIEALPPAQPEITLESAIDYLHSIGWMQNHDKQMYEDGKRHAQPDPEELDFVQPHKKIDVRLEIGQPDRSLWFRIGEICVDESKGFISAGRAIEKIRELLREAERREE